MKETKRIFFSFLNEKLALKMYPNCGLESFCEKHLVIVIEDVKSNYYVKILCEHFVSDNYKDRNYFRQFTVHVSAVGIIRTLALLITTLKNQIAIFIFFFVIIFNLLTTAN